MLGPDATANLAIRSTRSAVSPRSSAPAGTTADSRSSETTPHRATDLLDALVHYGPMLKQGQDKLVLGSPGPVPPRDSVYRYATLPRAT